MILPKKRHCIPHSMLSQSHAYVKEVDCFFVQGAKSQLFKPTAALPPMLADDVEQFLQLQGQNKNS